MEVVMLSTVDNPYNPLTDFDNWFQFDMVKGYNCCAIVDRIAFTSPQLSPEENLKETERAIDELIVNDPFNFYIKVKGKVENETKNA